jgi:hypothetical protein
MHILTLETTWYDNANPGLWAGRTYLDRAPDGEWIAQFGALAARHGNQRPAVHEDVIEIRATSNLAASEAMVRALINATNTATGTRKAT